LWDFAMKALRGISLLAGLAFALQPVCAQDAEIGEKRSDLADLKRRIHDLQRNLDKIEAERSSAAKAVAEAEREVSKAERAMRKLAAERVAAERQLAFVEAEQREIEIRIRARQDELAGWLRRQYIYGSADGVAALLAARNPNEMARDAHYLEILGRARFTLIESLRSDLELKAGRAGEILARRERLAELEKAQRQQREKLQQTHARRREALLEIVAMAQSQRAEVDALKADEARLAQVIETLVRRRREAAMARLEAQRAEEPVVGEIRHPAGPMPGGGDFARLRGLLRFPVKGKLIGRFGAPRLEGGTTWKGVFIRAVTGAEVHAISSGEVVYSDWLRGYGNLLIVDHGGDYLSVYGNNDALYKEVGDTVNGGDIIAAVGASGVEAESGLYFEIRHQGQALDPMQWVKLK
jgi:septal ring factor EnvC (AmiA/AmiB activator)